MSTKAAIIPVAKPGDCTTGTLNNLTKKQIDDILGFKPNCVDDPYKVKYSWGFTYKGKRCGVWDYKGSHKFNTWSTFGDPVVLEGIFGDNYCGCWE